MDGAFQPDAFQNDVTGPIPGFQVFGLPPPVVGLDIDGVISRRRREELEREEQLLADDEFMMLLS